MIPAESGFQRETVELLKNPSTDGLCVALKKDVIIIGKELSF